MLQWHTLSTMIFALGSVFGGLAVMLTIAFLKHDSSEE